MPRPGGGPSWAREPVGPAGQTQHPAPYTSAGLDRATVRLPQSDDRTATRLRQPDRPGDPHPSARAVQDTAGGAGTAAATPPAAGHRTTPGSAPRLLAELPAVHTTLIGVALPGLVITTKEGRLTGHGLEGFYQAGTRLLSRCRLRVAGREPLAVQARTIGADRVRSVETLRASGESGPDPDVLIERIHSADGTERITLHSAAPHSLRLPVEVALGTDLADLAAIAAGDAGPELPAHVHTCGLRWSGGPRSATVTAEPPPADALASAGVLRWELELPPGGRASVLLRVRPGGRTPPRAVGHGATGPLAPARATGEDGRIAGLLRTGLDDLRSLLLCDPVNPSDTHLAAGAPWRCGPAPADALAAARMALPLGTGLASCTLRMLARAQMPGPGPHAGMIPGPRRDAGPHVPPSCTGTEATLLFPVLLAEARRWGLPDRDTEQLLPAAERCLAWLRNTVRDGLYLPDPQPGGPCRAETQAHAHRAALLGGDLLDAFGRPGGDELRQWARAVRTAFRDDFWIDVPGGGRPAAIRASDGRPVPHAGAAAVHLLDTGLLARGEPAPGLLDRADAGLLARVLGGPGMDSGWGLRGLAVRDPGYNPFGHRSGAVRVHETALAVAGLATAGHEAEATSLLRGLLAAAEEFDHRLPEMYAGEQRTEGSAPLPHPAACRPAATAAASAVLLLTTVAGIRPDAPAGTVSLHPMADAPLGEVGITGLNIAGAPFSVRVGRLGVAVVEEAADGLQLGV
ncbi:glycogen debranching N-terminal domain-containing protein [Streptomyces sp. NPDC029526]|uniref:glycogen debranching N-terminal domain-containing protein n=1 Tax=Streptomyces sp. NPDC029526 TaxID=3155728 RepID=UPI0033F5BB62